MVASTFVRDVYEKIVKKDTEIAESDRLKLSRFVVVASGIPARSRPPAGNARRSPDATKRRRLYASSKVVAC